MDSTIPLLSKSKISSLYPSSVAVQPGLYRTWSKTPKTGFLITRLNYVNVRAGIVEAVTNVALGKTVTMSSLFTSTQYGDGFWTYAVDGNTNQNYTDGGCSSTNRDTMPWLLLDLEGIYTVTSLKIFNRVDYQGRNVMCCIMRKPAFCICENKGADQLQSNHAADQRLCFRYKDCSFPF